MKPHSHHLPRWLHLGCIAAILCTAVPQAHAQDTEELRVLTLDEAFQYALDNSPQLKTQEIRVEQQRLQMKASKARFKPSMRIGFDPISVDRGQTFNTTYNKWQDNQEYASSGNLTVTQPIALTDGTLSLVNRLSFRNSERDVFYRDMGGTTASEVNKSETYSGSVQMSYSQPIFTFNQTKMDLRELELSLIETEYNYVDTRLNLENNITSQFYSLYRTKASLEIAAEKLDSNLADYEITVNKVAAGIIAESELFQAETSMLNSQIDYEKQVQSFEDAKDRFKILIGMSIYEDFDIDLNIQHTPVEVNVEFATNIALQNRLDIKQQEFELERAQNDLIQAAEENGFSGTLNFSYGLQNNSEEIGDLFDNPSVSQSVGISLDVPVWDWGQAAANFKRTELGYQSTLINQEEDRKDIVLSIRQSVRELENLLTQIDMAGRSEESARRTLEIRRAEYQNGALSNLDLSQYQQQYSEARQSTIQARLDYKLALLQLKLDTYYDFETNESILPENILGEVD